MPLNYTLESNGDGTATLETFTVNGDGSAITTGVYTLTAGTVAELIQGLTAVQSDPATD